MESALWVAVIITDINSTWRVQELLNVFGFTILGRAAQCASISPPCSGVET
ncbi:uncharacterized protein PHALS_00170 [Plasmopara halstedii]|uniref:Uncharacterized protein n=1 Tax=Plasmopara halstedii TaxID=4781 RepID=A0A0P1A5L9_PLAHL|nr:uncharacterized protein PHALS_00170 [Plasmopara halstedii]CEG35841.1 hypothetical protein PHALS_00170 [Plasmopara halstedii]|eukprot:XP_024572210.1 hypothetical protein PHALS_00170 [Plasmopara halstedii]